MNRREVQILAELAADKILARLAIGEPHHRAQIHTALTIAWAQGFAAGAHRLAADFAAEQQKGQA